jgi:hypothetical protein
MFFRSAERDRSRAWGYDGRRTLAATGWSGIFPTEIRKIERFRRERLLALFCGVGAVAGVVVFAADFAENVVEVFEADGN